MEKAVDEELRPLAGGWPDRSELRRVKTQYRADFIRGVERIGGFGGKSDVLAQGEVFAGRPDFYKVRLNRVEQATPAQTPELSATVAAAMESTTSRCTPTPNFRPRRLEPTAPSCRSPALPRREVP